MNGVRLRPATVDNTPNLHKLLAALSPEDRRRRFLQVMPEVPSSLAHQLVDVDHRVHVAWLAMAGERCVAEARYVRPSADPASAELAYAVAPELRRSGLASRMVEALGVIARDEGVDVFTATVGTDNRASAALLRKLGFAVRFDDGLLEARGPVPTWTGHPSLPPSILAQHRAAQRPMERLAA